MEIPVQSRQDLEGAMKRLPGQRLPWLSTMRQAAFGRFAAHGLPTRREEEWKYSDMSVLAAHAALEPAAAHEPSADAARYARSFAQRCAHLLVFVDGRYSATLSAPGELPPGLQLSSLAGLLEGTDELPALYFDEQQEHTVFTALNNALAGDGAVVRLAPGTVLQAPVNLLFIGSGGGAIYLRNLVVAGAGARATVIEHHLGAPDAQFTDAVTQLDLAARAEVQHCKLVEEGGAVHVGGIHAQQAADSRLTSHSFVLGGRVVRNDITARLNGPRCACTLNGLYVLGGRQHVDHHTRIDHRAPSGTSREYYRGILDGESRGVFNGKVIVHPHADKTDAHQANQNLLLSRQAEADTKPQLEIFADDVKCTHGATVGQLDEDSLFYLRARGIDAESARSLLIYGFANDSIGRVEDPELRARLEGMLLSRLPQGALIKEML